MQSIALLGATGSIGSSTLKVLRLHPDRYRLAAVSAQHNVDALAKICVEFQPDIAVIGSAHVGSLHSHLNASHCKTQIVTGNDALAEVASMPSIDIVVAAIVGAAGLSSTVAAAKAGKKILLANKESLVVGGALVTQAARQSNALLLPIDSEHNALFQCLPAVRPLPELEITALWLTASGGPFRGMPPAALASVTPAQACKHPNWAMGRKISVDSATLLNKGLEVIEAFWLFGLPADRIKVVIHPQSVIHSLVEYIDGSFLAQLGSPDMCTPIAHALAYPQRINAGVQALNPLQLQALEFHAPDTVAFPCLAHAFAALKAGGAAPIVLNAAGEIAVEYFLNERLRFTDIATAINECLQACPISSGDELNELEGVLDMDQRARELAISIVERLSQSQGN